VKPQKGGILVGPTRRLPTCLYFFGEGCIIGGLKTTALPILEGIVDFEYTEPGQQTQGVGKFSPRLAESWKQVDQKTWEFTLRKGVKWHDGKDFTAEDVLWSIQRWSDPISNASLRTSAETFEKVESNGPQHVRITLKAPSPYFLDSITYIEPRILPAHIAKAAGSPTGEALVKLYDANPLAPGPSS
jgi:ABC-type transport system substrate-binding protein